MSWLPGLAPFQVIVIDCPWRYENEHTGGSLTSGAADQYEGTMSLEEICGLRSMLDRLAARDSVLFSWATSPLLDLAFIALRAWGWNYWGANYWIKDKLGMGWVVRNQVEPCLIARRGEVPPLRLGRNDLHAPVREHSEKPEEFFRQIEPALDLLGLNRRIELFARTARPGWSRWGNEAPAGDGLIAMP